MNTEEQLIYLQHTKLGIRCFESFVDSLIKYNNVVSDAELFQMMKRISKKLQTATSKWDANLPNIVPIKPLVNNILSTVPSIEEQRSIDEVVCCNKRSHNFISTSSTKINPSPGCSYHLSSTNYNEKKSIMMRFKDVDESLILGANGFYIQEITSGFWKCHACDVCNLPMNNLIAHINGKAHKKKINFESI